MSHALLAIEALSKAFGGLEALRDVDLAVEAGEIVGLIGPNGAGKTTLFELVSGYQTPTGGDIRFDSRQIIRLSVHERARLGIGRTFQVVQPFGHLTVLENVMVGVVSGGQSRRNAPALAATLLARVLLIERQSTVAAALTLPEKKRLELARALAIRPRLLLLDEVMAGLTPVEIDEMMRVLLAIRDSGVTMLIVEHVMQAVMGLSDRVVVLANGQKIAEGLPSDIARNQMVIEAYLGRRHRALA